LLPWIFKFFISAFIVDAFKTKKFWLLFTMFMLLFLSFLAIFFESFYSIAIIIFMLNLASATQDICVDWFAISNLKQEDLGLGNTIQVAGFKIGTLFSGGLLVYFMNYLSSISMAFFLMGTIYFICFILLYLLLLNSQINNSSSSSSSSEEIDTTKSLSFKERIILLHKSPGTYWCCIFVLIYKLGEQSSLNMLPIYLVDRNVSSQTIGKIR
jgi:MFS transporter, PAT family, beta-lactamase induction signal transducer AmpG